MRSPRPGGIDDVSDVEEHHVAKAVDMPAPHVVSSLFAALDVVPCVGELAQDTRGVPITGVREVPPLYVAEGCYAQSSMRESYITRRSGSSSVSL